LSDVRCADARRAQIGSPEGIGQCFHFRTYSSEPRAAVSARNLLSKDDWRLAGFNEALEFWPKVTFVVFAFLLAGA
jgi:hypothetical protein